MVCHAESGHVSDARPFSGNICVYVCIHTCLCVRVYVCSGQAQWFVMQNQGMSLMQDPSQVIFVCICVYAYLFACICAYAYMGAYTYTHCMWFSSHDTNIKEVHSCIHTYIHTYIHTHINPHTYCRLFTCTICDVHVYTYLFAYMCVYVNMCAQTLIVNAFTIRPLL